MSLSTQHAHGDLEMWSPSSFPASLGGGTPCSLAASPALPRLAPCAGRRVPPVQVPPYLSCSCCHACSSSHLLSLGCRICPSRLASPEALTLTMRCGGGLWAGDGQHHGVVHRHSRLPGESSLTAGLALQAGEALSATCLTKLACCMHAGDDRVVLAAQPDPRVGPPACH